jgi:hypothetical protein
MCTNLRGNPWDTFRIGLCVTPRGAAFIVVKWENEHVKLCDGAFQLAGTAKT